MKDYETGRQLVGEIAPYALKLILSVGVVGALGATAYYYLSGLSDGITGLSRMDQEDNESIRTQRRSVSPSDS